MAWSVMLDEWWSLVCGAKALAAFAPAALLLCGELAVAVVTWTWLEVVEDQNFKDSIAQQAESMQLVSFGSRSHRTELLIA